MRVFFIGLSLLLTLFAVDARAQEQATESSADEAPAAPVTAEPAGDMAAMRAEEIDELEPGVPTQVLTAESRPRTTSSAVMDELDLGATEITGNQELPKVMYIVPWRESDPGDLMGRPANTLLDEVLAPVDRSEFVREVDYYRDLFEESEEQ
jgi:hypothetical protein